MRLLAIADSHFGYESGKTADARKYIYESMFKKFEKIIADAKNHKVDTILHAGDLFNRSKPRKKVVQRVYELIERIVLDDFNFLVIPGNHERAKLPTSLLNFHKNCHFFNKLEKIEFDQYSIVGFPFIRENPQKVENKIQKLFSGSTKKPNMVLCHQLFEGATYGPHQFTFRKHHGAIEITQAFNAVDLIITGHIHRAQVLADGQVVYPGSIERTSFVESIEPKGYLLIDIEENFLKLQFHQTTAMPMDVIELDILNKEIDYDLLQSKIKSGLHRSLLRFTGRNLSTDELESISTYFPYQEYPLLVIRPQFVEQKLKPLYDRCVSFNFPSLIKKIKRE